MYESERFGFVRTWQARLTGTMHTDLDNDPWFVRSILDDWRRKERPLPWRSLRDPWAILVSELMSQQTQLARVVPAWERFMAEFPSPSAVVGSTPARVVELWDGLGYNRRAIHLHACAEQIVEIHGGQIPADLGQLMELPGVGPYTARAVLAFAFEFDIGVLDTNVGRVLARYGGRTLSPSEAQTRADALVPEGEGWRWNQALLDFGASTCVKRSPRCSKCPVSDRCAWAGVGEDPAIRSAGVGGRQSPFEGSDRQGRGRLVAALRSGPVSQNDLAVAMGWPADPDRARRVATGVLVDGLAVLTEGVYVLPGGS